MSAAPNGSYPASESAMQRLLAAAGWDAGSLRHKQLEGALEGAQLEIVERGIPAHASQPDFDLKSYNWPEYLRQMIARTNLDAFDRGELHLIANALEKLGGSGADAQPALIQKIEAEARRYADMYPAASDGRNTFAIFADWVAALSLPSTDQKCAYCADTGIVGRRSLPDWRPTDEPCPKCNGEGYINRHENLPDEPCPTCSVPSTVSGGPDA